MNRLVSYNDIFNSAYKKCYYHVLHDGLLHFFVISVFF